MEQTEQCADALKMENKWVLSFNNAHKTASLLLYKTKQDMFSNLVLCIFHTRKLVIRLWVLEYVTEEVILHINYVLVQRFHHNPITGTMTFLY